MEGGHLYKLPNNNKPIFVQVREFIEDQIINDQLKPGEQVPSTNQLVRFFKINHLTVAKGVQTLVEEGILFKKRGIGMFVVEGAKQKIVKKRKKAFFEDFIVHLVDEADKLGITEEEIIDYIRLVKGREKDGL